MGGRRRTTRCALGRLLAHSANPLDPREEHKKRSPDCYFFTQGTSTLKSSQNKELVAAEGLDDWEELAASQSQSQPQSDKRPAAATKKKYVTGGSLPMSC